MNEITQERRNINASETTARTKAVKALETTDFEKYMGSGFNIKITNLHGIPLCPEFVVNGEDMTLIAPPIAESLKQGLALKRNFLLAELKEIDAVFAG